MTDSYVPSKPQAYQLQAKMQALINDKAQLTWCRMINKCLFYIQGVSHQFASWEEGAVVRAFSEAERMQPLRYPSSSLM